jgi:hypothetical protein
VKKSHEEILAMRQKGMTMPEIAAVCGCSKQNIAGILKHQGSRMSKVDRFRADKSLILEQKQQLLLNALDKKKVEAMSGKDLMIAAAVAIDKQRLIDGHSASGGNISLLVIANRVHQEYQSGKLKGGNGHVIEAEVVSPTTETGEEVEHGEA